MKGKYILPRLLMPLMLMLWGYLSLAQTDPALQQEIAELEGLHVNTVARDLAAAEAWVGRLMNEEH